MGLPNEILGAPVYVALLVIPSCITVKLIDHLANKVPPDRYTDPNRAATTTGISRMTTSCIMRKAFRALAGRTYARVPTDVAHDLPFTVAPRLNVVAVWPGTWPRKKIAALAAAWSP
jgi:hypothetical protein